ncbi:unnamed protein product, partial [Anisakis simplex]|uniref:Uncharacterized protein n=1 Tax=Anisakis simplex TaxID=6269 RepID=A0A0M3JA50_ANISI
KSFRCFTQLPDKIGDANFETPSPKSSVSTRQSTFANPPHHLTNSVTVETDLNSQYSSSATATTIEPTDITDHRINNDLPLPLPTTFNNAVFMRRHQNDRESYSIL